MSFRDRVPLILRLASEIYVRERQSFWDARHKDTPTQRELAKMAIQEAFHVEDEMWCELSDLSVVEDA
jgi:hypothetical protein